MASSSFSTLEGKDTNTKLWKLNLIELKRKWNKLPTPKSVEIMPYVLQKDSQLHLDMVFYTKSGDVNSAYRLAYTVINQSANPG